MIVDGRESFGRWFDDFEPGQVFKHWPGKTVTEMDNHLFSLLTMNHNPLHLDENVMSDHTHGRILVNGVYVMGLAVGMSVRDTSGRAIANLEYERVTHDGPVFHGDTIYAESEVLDVTPSHSRPDRGVVHIETRAHNQRGERVLTLRRRFLVRMRAAEGC